MSHSMSASFATSQQSYVYTFRTPWPVQTAASQGRLEASCASLFIMAIYIFIIIICTLVDDYHHHHVLHWAKC